MSQHILRILGRPVRHIRKNAECRHIDKYIVIEFSHIAGKSSAIHYYIRSLQHILRNLQAVCKIVGTSRRHVTYGKSFLRLHHAGHHFVECAVPAAAHHHIVAGAPFLHGFHRVARRLRRISRHLIASLYKGIYNI